MEGNKENEQDYKEFENLLGETPNAASGVPRREKMAAPDTPHREDTFQPLQGKEGETTPLRTCSPNYLSNGWNHGSNKTGFHGSPINLNGVADAWKDNAVDQATTGCEQGVTSAYKEASNLPDDQYLTATFKELSLKEAAVRGSVACSLAKINGIPTNRVSQAGQPHGSEFLSELNGITALSNINLDGCDGRDPVFIDEEGKPHPSGSSAYNSNNQKMVTMFPESMFMNSGIHGFPCSLRPAQSPQDLYLDSHSAIHMPPNGTAHNHANLSNTEEVSYPQMNHQHYFFPQHQNMEDRVPMNHKTNNMCTWPTRIADQRLLEVPMSCLFEKSHEGLYDVMGHGSHQCFMQGPSWRGSGCSNLPRQKETPAHSVASYDAFRIQASAKVGREDFAEKIWNRSEGANSRGIRRSSVANASCDNLDSNRMLLPNSSRHTPTSNGRLSRTRRMGMPSHSPDNSSSGGNIGSSSQKFNSLDEVVGHIYSLAKDQTGCRFLQKKFEDGIREDMDKIFIEITDHIAELTTDPFGNYLVQKLVEHCNEQQRTLIVNKLTNNRDELIRISCDMHGTRSVQKVIEYLSTPEQFFRMASSLSHGIVQLMTDSNGNHVAQRCLQHMHEYNGFIYAAAVQYFKDFATNRHGCCVLQKCLHNGNEVQKWFLLVKIIDGALPLSMDQFGNYVVQYAIEHSNEWVKAEIFNRLQGSFGELSQQKSGSHVVERCITNANINQRALIIHELLTHPKVSNILQDPFGNYVIQTALLGTKGHLHAALVEIVALHQASLRSSQYGKRVLITAGFKK